MCVDSVGVVCVRTVKVLLLAVGVYYRTGNSAEFIYKGYVSPSYGVRRPRTAMAYEAFEPSGKCLRLRKPIQLYRAKKPDMRLRISQPPKHGVAQFLGHSELAKVESRVASWPFLFLKICWKYGLRPGIRKRLRRAMVARM